MTTLERLALQRAEEQMNSDAWRHRERYEVGFPPQEIAFKEFVAPGRCRVAGCWKNAKVKDLCESHYRALLRQRRASGAA